MSNEAPREVLTVIAFLAETAPGTDASTWMQVPGTTLFVPLMPGPGPVTTWRVGREGHETSVTVGELELAAERLGLFAEPSTAPHPQA